MFRRHPLSGDPVVLASARASRPNPFGSEVLTAANCPFCPGHEDQTPPEVARVEHSRGWWVRVVPNKYPAVDAESRFDDEQSGTGGRQEVVIETAEHDQTFDRLEPEHAIDVVTTWLARYSALRELDGSRHVALFKNHGAAAGASVPHIHSQVVALPFVPPRIERELAGFTDRTCPLCSAIERHRAAGLLIDESDSFVRLAPAASSMPYQQWIVPKAHAAEIRHGARELAPLFRAAAAAYAKMDAAYNWTIINFPEPRGHAYVDLFPRLTALAGFEFGTGCNINIVDPHETVRQLTR